MREVWLADIRPAARKLTLLALADWSNDDGGSLFPSTRAVAVKVCVSHGQAQRLMRGLIDDGLVEVMANASGGAPGQTRQLQLRLDRIALIEKTGSTGATRPVIHTGGAGATPTASRRVAPAHETGSTDARRRVAPAPPYPSLIHQVSTAPVDNFGGSRPAIEPEYALTKESGGPPTAPPEDGAAARMRAKTIRNEIAARIGVKPNDGASQPTGGNRAH